MSKKGGDKSTLFSAVVLAILGFYMLIANKSAVGFDHFVQKPTGYSFLLPLGLSGLFFYIYWVTLPKLKNKNKRRDTKQSHEESDQ